MRRLKALLSLVLLGLIGLFTGSYLYIEKHNRRDEGAILIYGSMQNKIIDPVLDVYRRKNPGTKVAYLNIDGEDIYKRSLFYSDNNISGADILLSTAMDLQTKFVNDGYATEHISADARSLPPWARWRYEEFGVAFEPVVMVFNSRLMAGRPIPQSRAELVQAIEADPEFWKGRIGAYDIRHRGIGYLVTSQESRQASDFGALMKSFGLANVSLQDGGGAILENVATGRLVLGYNVLETNARRRAAAGEPLIIIYPRDFTLAVLRTVVIPRNAPHPVAAAHFLDFLLSQQGQKALAEKGGLNPIRGTSWLNGAGPLRIGIFRPVSLGPGLLVYLDSHKKRRLLANWQSLVANTPK